MKTLNRLLFIAVFAFAITSCSDDGPTSTVSDKDTSTVQSPELQSSANVENEAPEYSVPINSSHIGAENPGFSDPPGECPVPPEGQEGWWGWHFVMQGNAEFAALSVTFEYAGNFYADPYPGDVFVADPDKKHAYIWTPTQDKLIASSAEAEGSANQFVLSHVCEGDSRSLEVSKTVNTSYSRTHEWDIDKKVETDNEEFLEGYPKIWLLPDGSGDESAEWTVSATYLGFEDSDHTVYGDITIENIGITDKEITSVVDNIVRDGESDIPVTPDCGVTFPHTLPAGETLTCPYSVDVDGEIEGDNEVTVTVDGEEDPYETTEPIPDWGDPDPDNYTNVNINDISDLFGDVDLGALNAYDLDVDQVTDFTYSEDFEWQDYYDAEECGSHNYDNTATIVETEQSADAALKVNVMCEFLEVSKTVDTFYNRTHEWDIDKRVDTENEEMLNGFSKIWLYTDGGGDETATWTVDVTYLGYEDSDHNVSGTITIENTGNQDAVITDVDDVLGGTSISVDCDVTFPHTLPVDETLTCTYSEDGEFFGDNVVTVTTEFITDFGLDPYDATEPIVWGDPDTDDYAEIEITDSNPGFAANYGDVYLNAYDYNEDEVISFTYDNDFAWADYGEENCEDGKTYLNTATIVETGQTAAATLKVNVQCFVYESAWAKGEPNESFCDNGFNNWGWTNPMSEGNTQNMPLWAGAGQCDISKGTHVGYVEIDYNSFTYTYHMKPGFDLTEYHIYAGETMFPQQRRGGGRNARYVDTVAPGQYYIADDLEGGIWVIAHGVVGLPDPNFGPAD